MSRKYKNPPIVEAVCEFQFDPQGDWDIAMPGLIYERVQNPFKTRKAAKHVNIEVTSGESGIQQQVQPTERIQFIRDDGNALIQVGPHLLTINHLKPYPSWEDFLPLIKQGFEAYHEVASPEKLARIGLRYINRIEIPSQEVDVQHYFRFVPHVEDDLAEQINAFIIGIQVTYDKGRDALRVQLANASARQPSYSDFILDLDYGLLEAEQLALSNAFQWVETAHSRIEDAFEACIREPLRDLFEEEQT